MPAAFASKPCSGEARPAPRQPQPLNLEHSGHRGGRDATSHSGKNTGAHTVAPGGGRDAPAVTSVRSEAGRAETCEPERFPGWRAQAWWGARSVRRPHGIAIPVPLSSPKPPFTEHLLCTRCRERALPGFSHLILPTERGGGHWALEHRRPRRTGTNLPAFAAADRAGPGGLAGSFRP